MVLVVLLAGCAAPEPDGAAPEPASPTTPSPTGPDAPPDDPVVAVPPPAPTLTRSDCAGTYMSGRAPADRFDGLVPADVPLALDENGLAYIGFFQQVCGDVTVNGRSQGAGVTSFEIVFVGSGGPYAAGDWGHWFVLSAGAANAAEATFLEEAGVARVTSAAVQPEVTAGPPGQLWRVATTAHGATFDTDGAVQEPAVVRPRFNYRLLTGTEEVTGALDSVWSEHDYYAGRGAFVVRSGALTADVPGSAGEFFHFAWPSGGVAEDVTFAAL